MATQAESRPYMDKVVELRKKFLDKHYASDKNYYDSRDISRVKSDDIFVQQYLAGRDGNVDKAYKMMDEALKWRKEFGINDVTEKDVPEEILKSGYICKPTQGKDKKGANLVFINCPQYTKGGKDKLLGYKKLCAYTFEKVQREHPGERLSLISNFKDAGLANMEMDYLKFVVHVQTTIYPDLLENAYVLSFPKLLEGIWKILKALMGSKFHTKYIFLTPEEVLQYVDKDQLTVELGGKFEYKYPPEEKTDSNCNEPAAADEVTS